MNFKLIPSAFANDCGFDCVNHTPFGRFVCQANCRVVEATTDVQGTGPFDIIVTFPDRLPENFRTIGGVIGTVIGAAIVFAAILALIFLLWGGLQWITSGGDKQGIEDARNRIVNAIVGLVIVAAGWAIFALVQRILVGDILTLGG